MKSVEKRAADLEKQLADLQSTAKTAPPQGDNKAIIKHLFAEVQRQMNEALEIISVESDKEKYKTAFVTLLKACVEKVGSI